ncbi:transposable element Tcb1 transposase [Trichonephila clavipes]|nr:transposable element Tcb1 transposase [Trichonephila clavipes]
MGRSDVAIRRCWQEWMDSGRFQCHDGSGRPKATADREDGLTIRSVVTALDSSLSTIRLPWPYFQQDNAKPHMARVTVNCLTACKTLPCPARSPDISPIEHVWDMKGRRLRLPGNVDHLTRQLEQIWQEIPQETIREPYHSMPRCVVWLLASRLEDNCGVLFSARTTFALYWTARCLMSERTLAGVLDESRSFFRVHTGYFSNIPKCIKAEFIASWACSQSSVVSSSQR